MKKLLVVLVCSLLCCMSCGSDDCPTCPRPPGASGSPPVISVLNCRPESAARNEGGGSIRLNCTVSFIDPDRDLDEMFFSSQECGEGPWGEYPVLSDPALGDVSSQAEGQREGEIVFGIFVDTDCEDEGPYLYEISALDSEDNESKPLKLFFVLTEPESAP